MGFTPICRDCIRDAKATRYIALGLPDNSLILRKMKCFQCGMIGICVLVSPMCRDVEAEREVTLLEKMWKRGVE